MGIKSPCYMCKDRKLNCHTNCKAYKDYANALQEINIKRRDIITREKDLYEYQIDKHKRLGR